MTDKESCRWKERIYAELVVKADLLDTEIVTGSIAGAAGAMNFHYFDWVAPGSDKKTNKTILPRVPQLPLATHGFAKARFDNHVMCHQRPRKGIIRKARTPLNFQPECEIIVEPCYLAPIYTMSLSFDGQTSGYFIPRYDRRIERTKEIDIAKIKRNMRYIAKHLLLFDHTAIIRCDFMIRAGTAYLLDINLRPFLHTIREHDFADQTKRWMESNHGIS